MSRPLRALLASAVLLPAICPAQENQPANPFSYSYAEVGYAETEFEVGNADIDGDGFTLGGSYEINDEWHVFGSIGNADLDFDIDLDSWVIGAGYRYPLRNDLDVYGRVMFVTLDVSAGAADTDDDGLGLQVRLRKRVSAEFELEGGVQYLNVNDSDTSLQAEGRYYFQETFAVGIGLTFGGDADGMSIAARLTF